MSLNHYEKPYTIDTGSIRTGKPVLTLNNYAFDIGFQLEHVVAITSTGFATTSEGGRYNRKGRRINSFTFIIDPRQETADSEYRREIIAEIEGIADEWRSFPVCLLQKLRSLCRYKERFDALSSVVS